MTLVHMVLVAATLLAQAPAVGDSKKNSPEGEGWKTIFDGTSMKGWKASENTGTWKLEDGALVTDGERSHLFYVGEDEPFKNFELKVDVMTKPGSNGGIYFHTKYQDTGWPDTGLETQVNNTFEKDPQKTGTLYNIVKVLEPPAEDNKWWTQHIIVRDNHVQVKVDGKTVVDYTQPEMVPEGQRELGSGTFALQAHDPNSTVLYRNIRVKRLP